LLPAQDISPSQATLQEDRVLHYAIPVTSILASPQLQRRTLVKRFAMAVVLACALSGPALAGDVPSTGAPAPQPPSTMVTVILTILSIVG